MLSEGQNRPCIYIRKQKSLLKQLTSQVQHQLGKNIYGENRVNIGPTQHENTNLISKRHFLVVGDLKMSK